MPIVALEPGHEALGALSGGVAGSGVGPLTQCGLDEAFSFAVDTGGERPGVAMARTRGFRDEYGS